MNPSPRARCVAGFALLLTFTAALRSVDLHRPLVGNFATKNATYAMIARNWATGRSPWWLPATDCLAGGTRGWHLVELPVSAYVAGAGWRCFGGPLDVWGRATSVAWSVAAVAIMFWLVRRWHGTAAGWGAATTLALSPVAIIVGQSFMLEASLTFFTLATAACFEVWLSTAKNRWLLASTVCFALLTLTKIYMLVLAIPLMAMWLRAQRARHWEGAARRATTFVVASLVALLPAGAWYGMAWRLSAADHPESSRVFFSIRTNAERHDAPARLLGSGDFYRQALDDLAGPVLTPLAFALVAAALWDSAWRRQIPWLASAALLVFALPGKFQTLLYYYMAVLPPLCFMAGLGWRAIFERLRPGRVALASTLAIATALSLRHAVGPAYHTPPEDLATVAAASALKSLADPEQSVATLHGSSSDLLYYCDRPGWALNVGDLRLEERLADCRVQGGKWLATVGLNQADRERLLNAGLRSRIAGAGFEIFSLEVDPALARQPSDLR